MSGIRPSSLPLAEHCGHSVLLSERYPQGSQYTEAGTAIDVRIRRHILGEINDPEAAAIVATLPAHKAIRVGVKCSLTDPDTGEAMWSESSGELDIELEHDDGSLTIVDIKNGRVRNYDLQMLAYGLARALALDAPRFRVMPLYVQFPPHIPRDWIEAADYWGVLERIRAANARDRNVPVTGVHCSDCFRRSHCVAFLLPAVQVAGGSAAIEAATKPGGVTEENALSLWLAREAMREASDKIEALLKTYADESGGLRANGKIWSPVYGISKRSISLAKVEAAGLLPLLEQAGCVSGGKPGEAVTYRWRNEKEPARRKGTECYTARSS